ncbi:MAG: hypothetical protein ABJD68_13425, partial [Nakamurella sp.]
ARARNYSDFLIRLLTGAVGTVRGRGLDKQPPTARLIVLRHDGRWSLGVRCMKFSAGRSSDVARAADPSGAIAALQLPLPAHSLPAHPVPVLPGRIDVAAVVARLRHIDASIEPALVFSQLAEVWVPGVCDEVVIDLAEHDQVYRIRRPAGTSDLPRPVHVPGTGHVRSDNGPVVERNVVVARIQSAESSPIAPPFSGTVVCRWRDDYLPAAADASLIGLMIDHAVALIHRERLTEFGVVELPLDQCPGSMSGDGRMAAAVGVVMALHHVDRSKATNVLVRISGRTGRALAELAQSVVETGALPELPGQAADCPAGPTAGVQTGRAPATW